MLGSTVASAGCDDPFVDPDDVLTFTLTTDSTTWDALTFDTIGGGCDAQYPYHVVEFRCGSEAPITIGARHKRGDSAAATPTSSRR